VKTIAYDLQINPSSPKMRIHRLDRAKDPNFWSGRVNDYIRITVHKTDSRMMLIYTVSHEKAYKWAKGHMLERRPTTGVAQLLELREVV